MRVGTFQWPSAHYLWKCLYVIWKNFVFTRHGNKIFIPSHISTLPYHVIARNRARSKPKTSAPPAVDYTLQQRRALLDPELFELEARRPLASAWEGQNSESGVLYRAIVDASALSLVTLEASAAQGRLLLVLDKHLEALARSRLLLAGLAVCLDNHGDALAAGLARRRPHRRQSQPQSVPESTVVSLAPAQHFQVVAARLRLRRRCGCRRLRRRAAVRRRRRRGCGRVGIAASPGRTLGHARWARRVFQSHDDRPRRQRRQLLQHVAHARLRPARAQWLRAQDDYHTSSSSRVGTYLQIPCNKRKILDIEYLRLVALYGMTHKWARNKKNFVYVW